MTASQHNIKLSCIIDDDEVYINMVKKIMDAKKLSENILFFKNGQEAIDHFKPILETNSEEDFPELILLDIKMPVMDGWKFLEEFAELERHANIKTTLYVVSSSPIPYDIEKAKSYSFVTDYLIKPLSMTHFENLFVKSGD